MFQKKKMWKETFFSSTKNNQQSELEMIWRSQAGHQRIALRPLVTLLPFPMLSCLHTGKSGCYEMNLVFAIQHNQHEKSSSKV